LPYSQSMRLGKKRLARERTSGELALIEQIRSRAKRTQAAGLLLGIGDDCALLRPRPSEALAVTTDLSIAGRHFLLEGHPPEVVGNRTLVRGLSDLAAMGARPLAAFLSLGLPAELVRAQGRERAWVDRFLDGLLTLAESYGVSLAGGDLAESPLATADIIAIGTVAPSRALLRSGAKAGDNLYVTGQLGGSAAGLEALMKLVGRRRGKLSIPLRRHPAIATHFNPQPRVAQGLWLGRHGASAAMDLSDGLSTDLTHLCAESGVAAEVEAARLPLHPAATLAQALHGGEDYELLFTAPAKARMPRTIAGVAVTRIGRIVRRQRGKSPVMLIGDNGSQTLEPGGWQHFA
jgi:thiamine-monophosphate kinase